MRADLRVFQAILDKRPDELVALLGQFQSGRAPAGRDTWYAWLDKPAQLSSLAYLKVIAVIREWETGAEGLRPATPPATPAALERRVTSMDAPKPRQRHATRP